MNAPVIAQLGMKRGSHDISLANEGGKAIAPGQNVHAGADFENSRSTDKHHLQRTARERGFAGENAGVNLAAEGIALNNRVEDAQASLGGIADLTRKQDGSGACAKDRTLSTEPLQVVKEATPFEELEHCGGLTAGEDQPVEIRKLIRLAHFDRRSA